ncbi:hypothetical protein BZA70DRAFT_276262 [Myxozyma melibiosi]|uniref:ER membrane protein complex subunit 10 n=1 Tax=Myxozyma melibiosi TaxID=54550 RepID=A0ABR1F8Y9_9ASCO
MKLSSALGLLLSVGAALALEVDDFLESYTVAVTSPGSSYSSSIEFAFNTYTKSASLLSKEITPSETSEEGFYVLNGQSLTDELPLAPGSSKGIYSIHLSSSGRPWHIDYGRRHPSFPSTPEVNVVSPAKGPVATLKAPVIQGDKVVEEDNRSFIQKYWMFIVPMLLVFMLGGGGGQ